jgi:hypothetical protein
MRVLLLALLGSALGGACALDAGAWEPVMSTGEPPTRSFGHAAAVPGCLFIAGNDTSQVVGGAIDVWRYNTATSNWVSPYDYPKAWTTSSPQPFLFSTGGVAVLVDELAPNTLFTLDSQAASGAGWLSTPVTPITFGAGDRWGQRFLSYASSLFVFGGVTAAAPTLYRNDLYALALTTTLNPAMPGATPLAGWNLVSPPPNAQGLVAGYPEGRVGPSWTESSIGALLYGGVATSDGSPPWPACMDDLSPGSPAPPQCTFRSGVYLFCPGYTDWWEPSPISAQPYPAAAWTLLSGTSGAAPAGRAEHIAGSSGDVLYIYGGFTAQGPVSAADALWAFDAVARTWSNPAPRAPAPPVGRGVYATGAFLARHLYVFVETYDDAGKMAAPGALWRYAPPTAAPVGAGAAAPTDARRVLHVLAAQSWGIAINAIAALAAVYLCALLVADAGIAVIPGCARCKRARAAGAPPGFYSTAPGAPASAYNAPI